MKSMRLHAINDFRLENIEKPVPKGDEILIKTGACGICGSDIPRVYQLGTKVYPVALGHEFSGTVVAVGNDKDKNLIGKKTAVFPLIPCRVCEPCQVGEYCQCKDYDYLGSRSDGGFAEYVLIPSKWHLVIPENQNVDLDKLSLSEPACVAQHALRRGNVSAGQVVVILGAGPIGILSARWAKIFGVKEIILTDIDKQKQQFAQDRGFKVINSKEQNLVKEIMNLTDGRGADVVIEGTGSSIGTNQAVEILRMGGTMIWLGNPHDNTIIDLNTHSDMLRKELNMFAIWNSYYADTPLNEWKYTIEMISNGELEVADLITHRTGIDNLKKLFDEIQERKITICKAIYTSSLD